jgi:predicted anti-sigma-YlaC factor YlaD
MTQNSHDEVRKLIATSAGDLSEAQQTLLQGHLQECVACRDYAAAAAEIVRAVRAVPAVADPTLVRNTQARVRARAIELRKRPHWSALLTLVFPFVDLSAEIRTPMRQHNVQFRIWAAFAVALSMSIGGSALMYQGAKVLAAPMHFDTAQIQAGVLVFWLLPSLCAALCLLAAPGENRGIA